MDYSLAFSSMELQKQMNWIELLIVLPSGLVYLPVLVVQLRTIWSKLHWSTAYTLLGLIGFQVCACLAHCWPQGSATHKYLNYTTAHTAAVVILAAPLLKLLQDWFLPELRHREDAQCMQTMQRASPLSLAVTCTRVLAFAGWLLAQMALVRITMPDAARVISMGVLTVLLPFLAGGVQGDIARIVGVQKSMLAFLLSFIGLILASLAEEYKNANYNDYHYDISHAVLHLGGLVIIVNGAMLWECYCKLTSKVDPCMIELHYVIKGLLPVVVLNDA